MQSALSRPTGYLFKDEKGFLIEVQASAADLGHGELCINFVELCPLSCLPLVKCMQSCFPVNLFAYCLINGF
jgi:hypothetical protein